MALQTLPIDATNLTFRYSGAAEHFTWDDGERAKEQSRDEDTGLPLFKVRCVVSYRAKEEAGEISVVVPCSEPPAAEFESHVMFTDLHVKPWSMNGSSGQSWAAASFTALSPTTPPSSTGSSGRKKTTEEATT
jgi:hypothetical protein